MPHISKEEEKLMRQLSVAELRHLLTVVMTWQEVTRILGLCIVVQECNHVDCALCLSMKQKLGMT